MRIIKNIISIIYQKIYFELYFFTFYGFIQKNDYDFLNYI